MICHRGRICFRRGRKKIVTFERDFVTDKNISATSKNGICPNEKNPELDTPLVSSEKKSLMNNLQKPYDL